MVRLILLSVVACLWLRVKADGFSKAQKGISIPADIRLLEF
jgi:hypothetical protein